MIILLVHNYYQQAGGEDVVFGAETELLRSHGHRILHYVRDNKEADPEGSVGRVRLAVRAVWASDSHGAIGQMLLRERPDVVHFHNIFPLVSPAAYHACYRAGVPVVQTVHNYRLLCPAATFLRRGRVCEVCLGRRVAWPGVVHRCYRGSLGASATVAAMLAVHRGLATWTRRVDRYIALTKFSRAKLIQGGLPADRIVVKPNFVHPDPGARSGGGEYALFAGRLSPEKGLNTLAKAWRVLSSRVPLVVVGDGPERKAFQESVRGVGGVSLVGQRTRDETLEAIKKARFLVFPSTWYEGFPLVIGEAFACGVPVIGTRLGAMAEMISHRRTGLLFERGNAGELATQVDWAWEHPGEMDQMGRAARTEYEAKYTADRNYSLLMQVYAQAIETRARTTVFRRD